MLLLTLAVGAALWFLPPPEGVSLQAWRLFALFIATIFGIISRPLPAAAMAFVGLTATVLTGTLSYTVAFSGFCSSTVWLIVFTFFIARGIIKTGLGNRLSFLFMQLTGKNTLGLAYGLAATDLLLAPAIPSSTARTGGVILPIVEALSDNYESKPHSDSAERIGSFLSKAVIQVSCITSAMFLTAMAANPLAVDFAAEFGIKISWLSWAGAALLPGLVSLAALPYLIYKFYPPEIKESPEAPALARAKLQQMGKMRRNEWIMLGTFLLLIALWAFAPQLGIIPTVTAMLGLALLLVTDVLTWDDVRKEAGAWETLVWFAILLTMATQLGKLGFIEWISALLSGQVQGLPWQSGFLILSLIYFYSHYLFASNIAHVGAMYSTFLGVSIAMGTPPMLAAFVLGFFSSLFGALTQYSCGPAAILFGAGYVRASSWWQCGLLMSLFSIAIWLVVGGLWWKFLGIW